MGGDDTYYLTSGSVAIESVDEGIDTVITTDGGGGTIAANIENFTVKGNSAQQVTVTGNSLNNTITVRARDNAVGFAAPFAGGGTGNGALLDAATPLIYGLEQARLDLLNQSYAALRQSIYDGLALQTRLKPLLDHQPANRRTRHPPRLQRAERRTRRGE